MIHIVRLLLWTTGGDFIKPIDDLRIAATVFD
jgi:hypothetical protein